MFSVIIPLYNKADYIGKAIESVLAQTFPDLELIVVNDGSMDGSAERLSQYNDPRLRVINQANTGVSVARNNGAKHARFDYIAFLDADDWWHPQFLEVMQRLIAGFSDAALYGCRYYVVKNGQHTPAQVGIPVNFSVGYIDYFSVYAHTYWVPINCSFVVVSKLVFEQLKGFNPTLKFGEDFDLWVRIALAHKVAYVNQLLAFSNQDADPANRALGTDRCWSPVEHVTFNFDQFSFAEQQNPVLNRLLDGLRVRSLLAYQLNGWYANEVGAIIGRVDLSVQPPFYRFVYRWPLPVVGTYFRIMRIGSQLKQHLLQRYRVTSWTV